MGITETNTRMSTFYVQILPTQHIYYYYFSKSYQVYYSSLHFTDESTEAQICNHNDDSEVFPKSYIFSVSKINLNFGSLRSESIFLTTTFYKVFNTVPRTQVINNTNIHSLTFFHLQESMLSVLINVLLFINPIYYDL